MDNGDLGRLVGPTLAALASEDVVVIATTGDRPTFSVPVAIPGNARVAGFIPHDQLLRHVDVMVTNGGFGGVQHALTCGIPLVIGGDTEDKPEVAARVSWAGAGIDLRTATPRPERILHAVRRVQAERNFRSRARWLAASIAQTSALDAVERELRFATPVDRSSWAT